MNQIEVGEIKQNQQNTKIDGWKLMERGNEN